MALKPKRGMTLAGVEVRKGRGLYREKVSEGSRGLFVRVFLDNGLKGRRKID